MLQNIKDLLEAKENLKEIKGSMLEVKKETTCHKDEVLILKNEVSYLKEMISETKKAQEELLDYLKESLSTFDEIKKDLKKELYDFNLLKSHLQNKILEKFEQELQNELKLNLEKLKKEHKEYEEVKNQTILLTQKIAEIKPELLKFHEISKNIKKQDFELTNHHKKILEGDREKLELMKRIDTLERLISKMRHTSRNMMRM